MSFVDDFAAINRRLVEIKTKAEPSDEDYCPACDNGGFVCSPSPCRGQPVFLVCEVCFNPKGLPSP